MESTNIKRIYHLADIHLRTYKMHDDYKEIFIKLLNKLSEDIIENGFKKEEVRIVICGDFVHQKITISNEQLLLGTWFLKELRSLCEVIIIAGNHDLLENNNDRLDSVTPMVKLLEMSGINITYFTGKSDCYLDNNIVWCVYSIFDGNKRPDIDSVKEKYGKNKQYVGLFHAPINGLSTDLGYVFTEATSLEHFDGCDLVLCGDIHKRDILYYKETPIAMSGSLLQQSFGETVNKHGFLIWDIPTLVHTEVDIENNNGFYQFVINSIDDIETNNEKLTNIR